MFEVHWRVAASDEMARFIRENPGRRWEFAYALGFIEGRLSKNPLDEGESREGDERVMFADPLAVTFVVDQTPGRAVVEGVRLTR
jgi:hypothetical protein